MSYAHTSYRNRYAIIRDFSSVDISLVQKTKDRRYCTQYNSLDIYDIEILRHVYQRSQQLRILWHIVSKSMFALQQERIDYSKYIIHNSFFCRIRQLFDTADHSYTLPSHRLTVYIIGVFAGYLLRNIPKDFKLGTVSVIALIVHIHDIYDQKKRRSDSNYKDNNYGTIQVESIYA